jgi:hypothetical protein
MQILGRAPLTEPQVTAPIDPYNILSSYRNAVTLINSDNKKDLTKYKHLIKYIKLRQVGSFWISYSSRLFQHFLFKLIVDVKQQQAK